MSHLKSQGCPCCLFRFSWILWVFPCFSWLLFDLFASFLLVFPCVSSLVLASCFLLLFGFFLGFEWCFWDFWSTEHWSFGSQDLTDLTGQRLGFSRSFHRFFLPFGWDNLPRNSPKTPSLHLLGCTKPRVAPCCAQAVASGPRLHLGMMMMMEKWGDLMGFSLWLCQNSYWKWPLK